MIEALSGDCRYFLSYTGSKLPLKLLEELEPAQLANRNTYFCGYFDAAERLIAIQKIVYGEVEMQHRYTYSESGQLIAVEITDAEGEIQCANFAEGS